MKERAYDRFTPLAGVVSVVALIAGFALGADEPDADASAAKAVAYWSQSADKEMLISSIFAVSAATLVVFGAALRQAACVAAAGRERLASVAFAGIVIAATGILTIVSITFTAADTAGDVAPQVTQTLSALNKDFFFPMAIGFALTLIASGLLAIRTGLLPAWFGWLSILIGLLAFTPAGVVGFYATPVWILIVSVLLYLQAKKQTTASPTHPA